MTALNPVKLATIFVLVSLMLNAGLQSNRDHLLAVLRDYSLIGRALLANFIIVPILGVLAVRLFGLNDEIATGLLFMAIAPGVPFVVQAGGRAKGGSLGFAIALAFIMPALSVITFPITAQLVLPPAAAAHLTVAHSLISLILFQLLPLLVGMIISDRAPRSAEKLAKLFGIVFLVSVIALIVLLAATIGKSVASVYGSRGMLADATVVILSIVTGWLLGGPKLEFRRTLGIATALRNIGLCAFIAEAKFAGTLVPAAVITYLLVQFVLATIAGIAFRRASKNEAPAPA
jgi:BASS family bile acid:Na+ symporter